jgi:hypothetical protein
MTPTATPLLDRGGAMELLTGQHSYTVNAAAEWLERAVQEGMVTAPRARVYWRPAGYLVTTVYGGARGDYAEAVPYGEVSMPAMADWSVYPVTREDTLSTPRARKPLGYVTDARADNRPASDVMPEDEDAKPYEVYRLTGGIYAETHSLRGALTVLLNLKNRGRRY